VLPYGFIPFPVFNHGGDTLEKNIDYAGCQYLAESYKHYSKDAFTFLPENAVFNDKLLNPVRIALGFSKEEIYAFREVIVDANDTPLGMEYTADFLIIYHLSDAIVAR